MAELTTSGTIYGTVGRSYKWYIEWSAEAMVEGNYSDVSASFIMEKTRADSQSYNATNSSKVSLTINGVNLVNQSVPFDLRSAAVGTKKTLATAMLSVEHNSDGTKTISISASHTTDISYGTATASGTATLPAIPVATRLDTVECYIKVASEFKISPSVSTYSHSFLIDIGTYKDVYLTLDGFSSTEYIFSSDITSIPIYFGSEMYSQFPYNGIVGSIITTTYNGSVEVGTHRGSLFVFCSPDYCTPSIESESLVDTNSTTIALTNNANDLIQYMSVAKPTIVYNISDDEDTTAVMRTITVNGEDYDGTQTFSNLTTNKLPVYMQNSRVCEYNGYITNTGVFIKYEIPVITATVARDNPTNGQVNATIHGTFFNDYFDQSASTPSNKNILTLEYISKLKSDSDYDTSDTDRCGTITYTIDSSDSSKFSYSGVLTSTSGKTDTFDYNSQYDIIIIARDSITEIPTDTLSIAKGIPIFWWNEHDVFCNRDIYAEGNIYSGKSIVATYEVGDIYMTFNADVDPNTRFGGTWERIKDKFLLACGDTYSVDATGGREQVILSAAIGACNDDSYTLGYIADDKRPYQTVHNASYVVRGSSQPSFSSWNHSTPVVDIESTNREVNIMPPYIAVYIWRRIA